jgi:hypothetical protein
MGRVRRARIPVRLTHPYVEGRLVNHNGTDFQLAVGLNLTVF